MKRNRHKQQGFTLTEVLIALTILAGGMFVLVNAHFSALSLHMETQKQVDSRMLLEIAVARAEMGVAAEELSGGSDFGPRYPGYSYTYEAQQTGDAENPYMMDMQFFSVTTTLATPDGESVSIQFHTFLNPESSMSVQDQSQSQQQQPQQQQQPRQ